MSTMAFDTLKFSHRLQKAGMESRYAEALAEAQRDAMSEMLDGQVATREDIIKLDAKINLVHWMLGFNLALTASVLFSLLFILIQM